MSPRRRLGGLEAQQDGQGVEDSVSCSKSAGLGKEGARMAGRRRAGYWASAPEPEPLLFRGATVDSFYSPRIKPALPSSRRQPPRGNPTLLRPSRLPSARLEPAPSAGPQGALPPRLDGPFGETGSLSEGL